MRLAGFIFTKISAEKDKESLEGLKIGTSINIDSISQNKIIPTNKDEMLLDMSFTYGIEYSPEIAKISLGGKMLISVDSKQGKELLSDWEKKEMNQDLKLSLFNAILMKSHIKALELEDELSLPTHFSLPTLDLQRKE